MGPARRSIVARAVVAAAATLALLACLAAAATTARAVPFGSYGALQHKIQTGEIVKTVEMGRFIVVRYDDSGLVSYRVAAVKQDPSLVPRVFILGGSAVRECATSDAAMQSALVRRWGGRLKVVTLASSVQRLPSTLAAIDNLPAGRGGVVVIGVHEFTFSGTVVDVRGQLTGTPLLMTSRALHDFVRARYHYDPPNTMIPGLHRQLAWYQRARGVPAFSGHVRPYQRHRYDVRGVLPLAVKQALVSQFIYGPGAPSGAFFQSFDLNRAILRRCVTLARSKGYQVLIMEDPRDAAVVGHAWDAYKQRYQPVCRACATQLGAHYADLNLRTNLVNTDFYDVSHLLRSGRDKWTPALLSAILGILRGHPPVYLGAMTATVSDAAPVIGPGATETIACTVTDTAGKPLEGAEASFVWHFATGDVADSATTDSAGRASSVADISSLSPDVAVSVDVTVHWKGASVTVSVSFTPAAGTPTPPPSPGPSAPASPDPGPGA